MEEPPAFSEFTDSVMDIALRRMRAEDVSQVAEIEREAFAPLSLGTPFKRDLNNRYVRYLVAHWPDNSPEPSEEPEVPPDSPAQSSIWGRVVRTVQGVVRRDESPAPGEDIVGYVGMWFQGNEAHITEIAVRHDLRGNGLGELLLIGSVRAAVENGSSVVTLEVRVSNFIAQRLYEKYGFKTAGVRKGYYTNNREDALIMTTSPVHTDDYQKLFASLQNSFTARYGKITLL